MFATVRARLRGKYRPCVLLAVFEDTVDLRCYGLLDLRGSPEIFRDVPRTAVSALDRPILDVWRRQI